MPGAAGVWQLAALALLGRTAKLKSYQASFAAGNRIGFVNYITKDYIDRAVALAEEENPPSHLPDRSFGAAHSSAIKSSPQVERFVQDELLRDAQASAD